MRYLGLLSCLAFLIACGDSTGLSLEELLSHPVQFSVISGDLQSDTIEAMLADPLIVRLTSQGDGQPIVGALVNFRVVEEGCGSPFAGSALTDEAGDAAERWELGTRAGECTMEARAVKPDGTPVVYDTMRATIEVGAPHSGWFVSGTGTGAHLPAVLVLAPTVQWTSDRGGNLIYWTPSILSGPANLTYEQYMAGWWLTPTQTGIGQVRFANARDETLYVADFSVCMEYQPNYGIDDERLMLRLYGPTVEMPDPPCPSG